MKLPRPVPLATGVLLRPLRSSDAPALLSAFSRNREHLRPFDPIRPAEFWTPAGQQNRVDDLLRQQRDGRILATVIMRDEQVLGCIGWQPAPPSTTCARSGCWRRTGSWSSAGRSSTCTSGAGGRTRSCSSASSTTGFHHAEK